MIQFLARKFKFRRIIFIATLAIIFLSGLSITIASGFLYAIPVVAVLGVIGFFVNKANLQWASRYAEYQEELKELQSATGIQLSEVEVLDLSRKYDL